MRKNNKLVRVPPSLLQAFSQKFTKTQYLQFIVDTFKDITQCHAVGIRLLDDKGYMPYEFYTGFSKEFWQAENLLNIKQDQCICTRLVNKRLEPQDFPAITAGGSFCTNNLMFFFEGLTISERNRFRGRCVDYGYKSLAVIPIIYEDETIGIIHCADKQPHLLSDEVIEGIETLAPLIGEAVRRYCLEDVPKSHSHNKVVIDALINGSDKEYVEKQFEYLCFHDLKTGLNNRIYFDQQMEHFDSNKTPSVGLILLDIDGLKLLNDALGQHQGDLLIQRFAEALNTHFGSKGIIARIGGDEFAVLISEANKAFLEEQCRSFKLECIRIFLDTIVLNLSIGFALRQTETQSMSELFKEAEHNMIRNKLHHAQSSKNAMISILSEALKARDLLTGTHASRVQNYTVKLGKALALSSTQLSDLCLFAQFHDLGKIGIPDRILLKEGFLTKDEMTKMKEHSKIGYQLARTAPDLQPIARWILCHHENWDGSGYPLGLQGEDIPLECRILAIADAYDAMTNTRPYRKALSQDEALAELRKASGKQFDPRLVDFFITVILPGYRHNLIFKP